MKYYFICYAYRTSPQGWVFRNRVRREYHPFQIKHDMEKANNPDSEITLMSWQEITKEEYDLFLALSDK